MNETMASLLYGHASLFCTLLPKSNPSLYILNCVKLISANILVRHQLEEGIKAKKYIFWKQKPKQLSIILKIYK